jgi:hypothetical protein
VTKYKLVDSNGKEIALPSIVKTYQGEKATVTGFSAPKWRGSTGQVSLVFHNDKFEGNYCPFVINARIVADNG